MAITATLAANKGAYDVNGAWWDGDGSTTHQFPNSQLVDLLPLLQVGSTLTMTLADEQAVVANTNPADTYQPS